MKLLTHNLLKCNVKGCLSDNFPLRVVATAVADSAVDFNGPLIVRMLEKLDWGAFRNAVHELEWDSVPDEPSKELLEDEAFLQKMHQILVARQVTEGELQCRGCGRRYPITNGIPNMLLTDDEI